MTDLYIPTLHTFAMNNSFTGSWENFRFRIVPTVVKSEVNPKEVDMEKSSILAQYWHGPFCYEKSEVEEEKTFPMNESGRQSMKSWLEENV